MNKLIPMLIFYLIPVLSYPADWIITINGIKTEKKGMLMLAVYKGEEAYLDEEQIHYAAVVPIHSESMTITINDLAPGEYSFASFHDENGNEELDTGIIMPKEGFAFSGKKQPAGKPPKYKDAFVTIASSNVSSTAIMKYY